MEIAEGTHKLAFHKRIPVKDRLVLDGRAGSKVSVPKSLLDKLGNDTVISILDVGTGLASNLSDEAEDILKFTGLGLEPMVSPVLDISICKENGECLEEVSLPEPILFKMPDSGYNEELLVCSFLERRMDGSRFWSRRGVWRASASEVEAAGHVNQGVWCFANHLSIFGLLLDVLLGCTNLELLSEEGMKAIVEHDGWYRSSPAIFFWCIAGGLLTIIIVGRLWESWELRWGRTFAPGKNVSLCKQFLVLGPALLKHRYTAFVVYAKDVIYCMRTGRDKLRMQVLTQGVQRFLAVRNGIAVGTVTAHAWQGSQWLDTKASIPFATLAKKLDFHSGEAEEVVEKYFNGCSCWQVLHRFGATFVACHPLIDATRVGAGSMTVGKRTFLQVAGIFGVLASNALIFNFSGDLRAWEADTKCPITPGTFWFTIVATCVSVLFNAVPNAFLMDLAKQVHGRPGWIAVYWGLTLLYLGWALLLIIICLANLNKKDQAKWFAAMEWGMTIKLLGMPLAQTIRNTLMLEYFLREDRKANAKKRFIFNLGFEHPEEMKLSDDEQNVAVTSAYRGITTRQLVKFTSLLGDRVMKEFEVESSTCDQVLEQGVRPLCIEPPSLEDFPVKIEVLSATLPSANGQSQQLSCSVVHLDKQVGQERVCLSEQRIYAPVNSVPDGPTRMVVWNYHVDLGALQLNHAVGLLIWEGNTVVGLACLTAQEVYAAGSELKRDVRMLNPEQARLEAGSWSNHKALNVSHAHNVPSTNYTGGDRGQALHQVETARLVLKVTVLDGTMEALALHERWKLRSLDSDLQEAEDIEEYCGPFYRSIMLRKELNGEPLRSRPFCESDTSGAAHRIVIYSRNGIFAHVVGVVLADALGTKDAYEEVMRLLQKRDFVVLLEKLALADVEEKRYWLEMFAIDPLGSEGDAWHENVLNEMPTILRALRRDACLQRKKEAVQSKETKGPPLKQLLVLDKKYHLMHESCPMAEMMLAYFMRISQRFVLHPMHLNQTLGEEIAEVAAELDSAFEERELPWTSPFLRDKQKVYDLLRDLIVEGVKEHKPDEESTWKELSMTNVYAGLSMAAVASTRSVDVGDQVEDVVGDMGGAD